MAFDIARNTYKSCVKETNSVFGGSRIKEYSDWPTIPQLYVDKEFIGGCDILINMHKDGSLAELLADKNVLVLEESEGGEGDVEGQKAEAVRETTEQSTGGRSKDAKGESS